MDVGSSSPVAALKLRWQCTQWHSLCGAQRFVKMPSTRYFDDDLAMDLVHELEVVGPECAGHPEIRIRPVSNGLPIGSRGDPVGMRGSHLLARGMRIGPGDDVHPKTATPGNERPERIAGPEGGAAVVERYLGRIVGDDAAGAQACGVCLDSAEVVEPELRIEAAGIVLDERELRPSHRLVEPARTHRLGRSPRTGLPVPRKVRRARKRRIGAGASRDVEKIATGIGVGHKKLPAISFQLPASPTRAAVLKSCAGQHEHVWPDFRVRRPHSSSSTVAEATPKRQLEAGSWKLEAMSPTPPAET